MSIGEKIIQLRSTHNMQQKELADKLEINASVLNRIEKGTRPIRDEEITAIAKIFNVSTDYLLGNNTTTIKRTKEPMDLRKYLEQSEVIFDGDTYNLTPEEKDMVMQSLKVAFYAAKRANKRKIDDKTK